MLQGLGVHRIHRIHREAGLEQGGDEQALGRLDDTGDLLWMRGSVRASSVAAQVVDQRLQPRGRVRYPQCAALASLLVHDGDVVMRICPVDAGKPHPLPPVLTLSLSSHAVGRRHDNGILRWHPAMASCDGILRTKESQTIVALYAGARSATFYER
jgi:hypothetical protein